MHYLIRGFVLVQLEVVGARLLHAFFVDGFGFRGSGLCGCRGI